VPVKRPLDRPRPWTWYQSTKDSIPGGSVGYLEKAYSIHNRNE